MAATIPRLAWTRTLGIRVVSFVEQTCAKQGKYAVVTAVPHRVTTMTNAVAGKGVRLTDTATPKIQEATWSLAMTMTNA